jgi:putative GTP pyrophosphokinase
VILLDGAGVVLHRVEARAKSVDSFREKITRAGKHYDNPLADVTDLCGVRVIVYYLSDVDKVGELIANQFRVDSARSIDKRQELGVDRFGYLSVHFIVKVSKARAKLPEWREFSEMAAEIQVRTVLQHAWAAIEHTTQYKSEGVIPKELRRRLHMISALLEAADEGFQQLREERGELVRDLGEKMAADNYDIPISIDSIGLIRRAPAIHRIVEHINSLENLEYRDSNNFSDVLVEHLQGDGITTVQDLADVFERNADKIMRGFHNLDRFNQSWGKGSESLDMGKLIAYALGMAGEKSGKKGKRGATKATRKPKRTAQK